MVPEGTTGCQMVPEGATGDRSSCKSLLDAATALPQLLPLFVEANADYPQTGCQYNY